MLRNFMEEPEQVHLRRPQASRLNSSITSQWPR